MTSAEPGRGEMRIADCPRCGWRANVRRVGRYSEVVCIRACTRGPMRYDKLLAVELWNRAVRIRSALARVEAEKGAADAE